MKKIIILGAGGHAKTVIDTIEEQNLFEIAGLVEKRQDREYVYKGYSVIGSDDDLKKIYQSGIKFAICAVGFLGNSDARNKLYKKLKEIGYVLPVIIDDTAVVTCDTIIGEGTYIGRNAIISCGATIGKMCIINSAAVVEHDCVVGDFTHISVASVLCGGVNVGRDCMVGANATILQNLHIKNGSIIAAGTVITKDVQENTLVKNKLQRIEEKLISNV